MDAFLNMIKGSITGLWRSISTVFSVLPEVVVSLLGAKPISKENGDNPQGKIFGIPELWFKRLSAGVIIIVIFLPAVDHIIPDIVRSGAKEVLLTPLSKQDYFASYAYSIDETPTPAQIAIPVATSTRTPTPKPTFTNTSTPAPTATYTPSATNTPSSTPTSMPSSMPTSTPSSMPTSTPSSTPTVANTPTPPCYNTAGQFWFEQPANKSEWSSDEDIVIKIKFRALQYDKYPKYRLFYSPNPSPDFTNWETDWHPLNEETSIPCAQIDGSKPCSERVISMETNVPSLQPGSYTFMVKLIKEDGNYTEPHSHKDCALRITVK